MAKSLIFIDLPGFKALPDPSALKVAAHPEDMICVTDEHSARQVLESVNDAGCLVLNAPKLALFEFFKSKNPNGVATLVTDQGMEQYSTALAGKEFDLIEHVIANRSPEEWTTNELRITLQKIIRGDIFGLDKYLHPQTHLVTRDITGSAVREQLNTEVAKFAENNKLGHNIAKMSYSIAEELVMNAVFDAPNAAGRTEYSNIRTQEIKLDARDFSQLSYAYDGRVFGISVRDPFGAFKKNKYFGYLKKVLVRDNSEKLIDTKKGGAGLGLYKILYCSHALICNITPQETTEIIALIDTTYPVRDFSKMAKSIHFFCIEAS